MRTEPEKPETDCQERRAFTLVELLVILGILALLGAMLLPAVAGTKPDHRAFQCLNNLRRLNVASQMYAGDNNDRLVNNFGSGGTAARPTENWVAGQMSIPAEQTNTVLMLSGTLGEYVGRSAAAYKCPGDTSINCRSYSLNGNLGYDWEGGANTWDNQADGNYRHFKKLSDIKKPAQIITFLGENRLIMNDGNFAIFPQGSDPRQPGLWVLGNYPELYHGGAAGVSFADSHAEIKQWKDRVLEGWFPPSSYPISAANKSDAGWLAEHASTR